MKSKCPPDKLLIRLKWFYFRRSSPWFLSGPVSYKHTVIESLNIYCASKMLFISTHDTLNLCPLTECEFSSKTSFVERFSVPLRRTLLPGNGRYQLCPWCSWIQHSQKARRTVEGHCPWASWCSAAGNTQRKAVLCPLQAREILSFERELIITLHSIRAGR